MDKADGIEVFADPIPLIATPCSNGNFSLVDQARHPSSARGKLRLRNDFIANFVYLTGLCALSTKNFYSPFTPHLVLLADLGSLHQA